jgi:hypothetical protein
LTRSITIIALTCFLVVGAAATSILTRESMQATDSETPALVVKNPVANRESKHDRLTVTSFALASMEPQRASDKLSEPLRRAYASSSAADIEAAKAVAALPQVESQNGAAAVKSKAEVKIESKADPKVVDAKVVDAKAADLKAADLKVDLKAALNKPQLEKSYALLSDGQIAGIKERLKLSPSQESYWPAVETALRAVAHKIHSARKGNANATAAAQLDPDSDEVQQLKSAAMPLLFQLREDQKEEVRKLARIIGLDKVAAAI